MNQTFPKSIRITKPECIDDLFRSGRRIMGRRLYIIHRPAGRLSVGIICGKKIGNAVLRNRAKRMLREIFRRNKEAFGVRELLIVALPSIKDADTASVSEELLSLAMRLN